MSIILPWREWFSLSIKFTHMSELSEIKTEIQRTQRLTEAVQNSVMDVKAEVHDIKTLVAGNRELGIPGHGDTLQDHETRITYLERARGKDLVEKEKEKLKTYKKVGGAFIAGSGATAAGFKTGIFAKLWAIIFP